MAKGINGKALLAKAVDDYLLWMIQSGYASGTIRNYESALRHFQNFINHRKIQWDEVLSYDTLKAFEKHSSLRFAAYAVRGLSRYLFKHKLISSPIIKPRVRLPDIYEAYLHFYERTRGVHYSALAYTRNVLSALNDY